MRKIFLIVSFSLLTHWPGLTSPLLDHHAHRQTQTAAIARNYYRNGFRFFTPQIDWIGGGTQRAGTEFPLYSYLLALLYKTFGLRDWLGRLLSSVFAAASAVYLFLLVSARLGKSVGFWSAIVYNLLPVSVYFTRTVQPESLEMLGLIGGFYHATRFVEGGGLLHGTAAAFGCALAPLVKLPAIYIVVPVLLMQGQGASQEPISRGHSRGRKREASNLKRHWFPAFAGMTAYWDKLQRMSQFVRSAMLLIFVVVCVVAWYRYARTAGVGVLPLTSAEHLQNLKAILGLNLWKTQFISRFPELAATYPGLFLGFWGLKELWHRTEGRFFFIWWTVTAASIVLLGKYGVIHQYTALPFAPVNAVFIAAGAVGLLQRWQASRACRALVYVLLAGIGLHTALRIHHWYRLHDTWLFRAREAVSRVSSPNDLFLVNTKDAPVFLYHVDRKGFVADFEFADPARTEDFISRGARFFLTRRGDQRWEGRPKVPEYFLSRYPVLIQDPEFLLFALRS